MSEREYDWPTLLREARNGMINVIHARAINWALGQVARVAALEAERDDAEKRSEAWAQACAAAEAREKDALLSKRDEA